MIRELKSCIEDFHIGLRVLQVLVGDLPHSPLGTQVFKLIICIISSYYYFIRLGYTYYFF